MYYEEETGGTLNFFAGFAIGALVGASVALLAAPQSGEDTRRQIVRAIDDARREAGGEWANVARDVRYAVRRGRRRMRR